MKKIWKITGEAAKKAVCREVLSAPEGHVVTLGEPTRSLDANAAMWPILEAFAQQLDWPIRPSLSVQSIDRDDCSEVLKD